MSKKLSEEEFQQLVVGELGTLRKDLTAVRSTGEEFQKLVVEQFGKLTTEIADVRIDLTGVRTELGDVRRDVADVQKGLANVRHEMQVGFREVHAEIAEMREILEPLAKAFDNDAETIIEHDRRISRLEEHAGIAK